MPLNKSEKLTGKNLRIFSKKFLPSRKFSKNFLEGEIVKIFIRLEEQNYSILVYCNLISREIEVLSKRNQIVIKDHKFCKEEEDVVSLEAREEDIVDEARPWHSGGHAAGHQVPPGLRLWRGGGRGQGLGVHCSAAHRLRLERLER